MPKPHLRSSRYRRITRKTAKGTKIVWVKREKRKRLYDIMGVEMHGVSADEDSVTKKRPTRPFAGVLSGKTLQSVIKWAVKVRKEVIKLEDVPLKLRPFVEYYLSKL